MSSILESKYIEQQRPYSQNELLYLKDSLYKKLNLGENVITHDRCDHFYKIKKNSRKEKALKNNENIGNCSVCWKIKKTPKYLKNSANNMVKDYISNFNSDKIVYTYDLMDLESVFYTWLYLENENDEETKK